MSKSWISRDHPIVRRELAGWDRYRAVMRLFAVVFGLLCVLGLLSDLMTIFAPDALGYLFLFIQSLPSALAILMLKALLLTISAASVAREFEAHSWEALRLTGLQAGEILAGKAAAAVRVLWLPILIWMGLNATLTLVFLGKRLIERNDWSHTPLSFFFLAFDILSPGASVCFYLALGLLVSTLVSTQAKAVIGSLALFGALTLAAWIAERLYFLFSDPLRLDAVTQTLLEFGWLAGLAFILYKAAEWRGARHEVSLRNAP